MKKTFKGNNRKNGQNSERSELTDFERVRYTLETN